jgi:hypothetical protein
MPIVFKSPLMAFLRKQNSLYYGKVEELRNAIVGWLSYIPQTFPHYTRHTVQHSDEIILQLSKLLFNENKPGKPVVALSSTEIYILIASSYLHDAGMVVSDKEKAEILLSEDWKTWTTGNGGGTKRWYDIQEFRKRADETNGHRDFIADIQTRFLIAEFIRRLHHLRSASVITQHQSTLGRFAFDDPTLLQTIADVCVAHGLKQHELDDNERYPERRDIGNDKVNVRFLAILLRIGDLLDMSYDRACPLLLNAACPLPPDSLAHWTQYKRITHRLTAQDRLEIIAECETQEEHRYIQDWCQWLVDELHEARFRMARSARHNNWIPPKADLDTEIQIRPSKNATYIPSRWVFELDKDAVFQILVKDAYSEPLTFIRELIQNALDAIRCQMYSDIIKAGKILPEYPTKVDKQFRDRYPVTINLEEREVMNSLSGESESRQVLIINDCGIGMDSEIIRKYFLQVGRSYYTTDEFKRSYSFIPTSRFGVGFLSVFGISDHVKVDTYKPTSQNNDGAIQLTLTGPRYYLLTDHSNRRTNGTQIEVLLREKMEQGKLTEIITNWCRRVEFPIIVSEFGLQTTIEAERPEQFTYEMPDVTEENAILILRSFPVNRPGIEGDLYVLARITNAGESWVHRSWAEKQYPKMHPSAMAPQNPTSIVCLHGIATNSNGYWSQSMVSRLDYRRNGDTSLTRETIRMHRQHAQSRIDPEIQSRWEELLKEHLAHSQFVRKEGGWKYKQKLAREFDIPSFWRSIDGMIPINSLKCKQYVSLSNVNNTPVLGTTTPWHDVPRFSMYKSSKEKTVVVWDSNNNYIESTDIKSINDNITKEIFKDRIATNIRWLSSGHLAIDWAKSNNIDMFWKESIYSFLLAEYSDVDVIGFPIHSVIVYANILNSNNVMVKWLIDVRNACKVTGNNINTEQFNTLLSLFNNVFDYFVDNEKVDKLINYIEAWRKLPGLKQNLYPPKIEINRELFDLKRFIPEQNISTSKALPKPKNEQKAKR